MGLGLFFWILILFSLFFGFRSGWPGGPANGGRNYWGIANNVLLLVLIIVLGWSQFGAPLHK